MNNPRKIRRINREESFKIYELLKEYTEKVSDNVCEYKNGASDEKIAKSVAEDIQPWVVKDIRVKMFGELVEKQQKHNNIYSTILRRLEEVEALYIKLDDRVKRLEIGF